MHLSDLYLSYFHMWAHTICIQRQHLHSGVDPSSGSGVHSHMSLSSQLCVETRGIRMKARGAHLGVAQHRALTWERTLRQCGILQK